MGHEDNFAIVLRQGAEPVANNREMLAGDYLLVFDFPHLIAQHRDLDGRSEDPLPRFIGQRVHF